MVANLSPSRSQAIAYARQVLALNPVYLDTETTGLEKTDEIIEISIVDDEGKILFESLVKPGRPVPPEATQIHHITDDMVKTAPSWLVVWQSVRSILLGRTIAIYNAEYDLRLLQQTHARYRMPWKETLNTVCLMKLFAQYQGVWDPNRRAYRYYSLDHAGKICKINLPNSHRASDDTLLARALLHHIAESE
ncbi:MAG TPA: 3'-5' exonuclease [Anaerolineaceae bacterium]